jgi:hypothetical protein
MPLSVTSTNLPSAPLGTMATGFWVSRAIYVAAKIGIPDLLAQGPQNVELLAEKTRFDSNALYRSRRDRPLWNHLRRVEEIDAAE